jgi:hypothetical protein
MDGRRRQVGVESLRFVWRQGNSNMLFEIWSMAEPISLLISFVVVGAGVSGSVPIDIHGSAR